MGLLIYSGVCSLLFVAVYCAAKQASRQQWRPPDVLVVLWGLSYVVGLWFFWSLTNAVYAALGRADGPAVMVLYSLVGIGCPGAITGVLCGWATRDRRVVWGCLVGTALAGLAFMHQSDARLFAGPAVWHVCVGAGMLCFALDPPRPPRGVCGICGYDMAGLRGGVCPECGTR